MPASLEGEFHGAMLKIYDDAADLGYRPVRFRQMVLKYGGVPAAKRLLGGPMAQSGLTTLWELDRLDISMEALVVQERWKPLFSDAERRAARDRLSAHGYDPDSG
ncbi:MAG: hypothetical protein OXU21_03965 [Chloroflexota bacterium]|nr:hypothetical protein [Chloroflexota bacterium]